MSTLFEKYGGFATVSSIVRNFYKDLLAHDELSRYFRDIDMATLIDHQTKFISHALGGPAHYEGRSLKASHVNLSISGADFDEVAEILRDNLEDAGMSDEDIESVMGIVGSTRSAIVTRD